MKKPDPAAVLHLIHGLKCGEVPPGDHNLSRVQVVFTFPKFCAVARAAGKDGDGFSTGEPAAPNLALTPLALLLFIERCGAIIAGPQMQDVWLAAIRESLKHQGPEPVPAEAAAALAQVQAEQPLAPAPRIRTPAKRVGTDEVTFTIKRLPARPQRAKQSSSKAPSV